MMLNIKPVNKKKDEKPEGSKEGSKGPSGQGVSPEYQKHLENAFDDLWPESGQGSKNKD